MPEQRVSIRPYQSLGQSLDMTVADRDLSAGRLWQSLTAHACLQCTAHKDIKLNVVCTSHVGDKMMKQMDGFGCTLAGYC